MFGNIILPLTGLTFLYGLALAAIILVFRALGVSSRWRIGASFLLFGTVTGALVAYNWPQDSIYLYNFPAQFLGYEIYYWAIQFLGNPNSAQAHETIPAFLRIPFVFIPTAILFWGLLGALVQLFVNYIARGKNSGNLSLTARK